MMFLRCSYDNVGGAMRTRLCDDELGALMLLWLAQFLQVKV